MKAILTVILLLWARGVCAEEQDYFPLQVGNWWAYECVEPHPEVPPPVHGKTCVASDGLATVRVANTISLGLTPETAQYTPSELPVSKSGQTYFMVTGLAAGMAGTVMYPSGKGGVLLRRDPVENHILQRGSLGEELWTIYEEERLVYDLGVLGSDDAKVWDTGSWTSTWAPWLQGQLETPAGSFDCVALYERNSWVSQYVWFASGVGIVSLGDRDPEDPELSGELAAALELKAAFVNGIRYPASSTPVDPITWGKVKQNH